MRKIDEIPKLGTLDLGDTTFTVVRELRDDELENVHGGGPGKASIGDFVITHHLDF